MSAEYYKNLFVWQKAMDLVVAIYAITSTLPGYERFGLASQLQRAAVSIPSNIAEGSRRRSSKEFSHFCSFARGSAAELETQLLIIQRVYPAKDVASPLEQIVEIQKMLTSLIRKSP